MRVNARDAIWIPLLENAFSIPTVQRISGHVFQAFAGVIVARSGNHGFEIEVPSEERRWTQTNINMNSKQMTLQTN